MAWGIWVFFWGGVIAGIRLHVYNLSRYLIDMIKNYERSECKLKQTSYSGMIKKLSIINCIFEEKGCLTFEMLGEANSQLYIYINQI